MQVSDLAGLYTHHYGAIRRCHQCSPNGSDLVQKIQFPKALHTSTGGL